MSLSLVDTSEDHVNQLVAQLRGAQLVEVACGLAGHAEVSLRAARVGAHLPIRGLDAEKMGLATHSWLAGSQSFVAMLEEARTHNHAWRQKAVRSPRRLRSPYCHSCQLARLLEEVARGGKLMSSVVSSARVARINVGHGVEELTRREGDWQIAYLESILTDGGHPETRFAP